MSAFQELATNATTATGATLRIRHFTCSNFATAIPKWNASCSHLRGKQREACRGALQIVCVYNIAMAYSYITFVKDMFDMDYLTDGVEEEEEALLIVSSQLQRSAEPKVSDFAECTVPQMNSSQFKVHFRLLPETFEFVLNLIALRIVREVPGKEMVAPHKQLLVSIWRLATPESYRSIGLKFGIGRGTDHRCVKRVCKCLCELAPLAIQWPSEARARAIAESLELSSTFPGIIGAVDGTHIRIPAPHDHPESYVNRKGYHSIHLQGVCDHKSRFLHCYTGNVGSVHDARVFRLSSLHSFLGQREKFPLDTHLIGDGAYGLDPNLMTPYQDNGHLTRRQKNFNVCLSSARMVIERTFGLLKGRWRSLLHHLNMEKLECVPEHIISCCVLHNICIQQRDFLEELVVEHPQQEFCVPEMEREGRRWEGVHKRDRICATLHIRNG